MQFQSNPFQQTHFELFGIPQTFAVDTAQLQNRYRQLQRQFHPDRFAGGSEQEKRLALQYATRINEAYECLKSPLLRALYLMTLAGVEQTEHTTQADKSFLIQQMLWREQLHEAESAAELDNLKQETHDALLACEQAFSQHYAANDYATAQLDVDKMHFISKFTDELSTRLHVLNRM